MPETAGSTSVCVVLAAGVSQRFGSQKLSHVLPNGKTVLQHTVTNCGAQFREVCVVVRSASAAIGLDGVSTVVAEQADVGLSQSLIAGVSAYPNAGGWLIMLGDMPYVQKSTIAILKDVGRTDNIVQPVYRGQAGNPVWFGRQFYTALLGLTGDRGGREILKDYSDCVAQVAVNDPGIHHDIDLPGDVL